MDSPIKATPEVSGFCARCDADVRTVRPWPHWKLVRRVYLGILCVVAMSLPLAMMDVFVMTPMLGMFFLALGPLNGFAAQVPTCARCGGIAAEPPRQVVARA